MSNFLAFGLPQGGEWIIILLVVIVLFGAKKLPELARGIGKSMGEFKKAKEEFDHELQTSMKEAPKATVTPAPGAVAQATPVDSTKTAT